VLQRRRRRRAHDQADPVLRDAGHPGHLAERLEAVPSTARSPSGSGRFDQDRWQLFHTDTDRSEAHDLADQHPDKLEELKALWLEEAKKYDVLPLNDLTIFEFRALEYTVAVPPSGQYTCYPGTSEVPEASAANTINVSYKILAEVEFTPDAQGVIFAQGSRFGGYSLFVKDGKLTYVYNFLGIPPEQRLVADAPTSGTHVVGVEFTKERAGEHHEPYGPMKLHVDDRVVATDEFRTIASRYSLCGEGLCIGYDGGDAVSSEYTPLLFVNAKRLRDGIRAELRGADPPVRVVLLDLSFTPALDITSVNVLASLRHELEAQGVALWLGGVHAEVQDMLERSGLADDIGRAHLYRNLADAAGDASA
jgi:anti-anti-sigma regulatory factor